MLVGRAIDSRREAATGDTPHYQIHVKDEGDVDPEPVDLRATRGMDDYLLTLVSVGSHANGDRGKAHMDTTTEFYQTLSGMSFTLLGIWFAVMQFSNGQWRSQPWRHRSNLHIALHFFLPGFLGLGALLSGGADDGLIWRTAFVIGGLAGLIESLSFLRVPGDPFALASWSLRMMDPVLYALMFMAAVLPSGLFVVTSLQIEGIVTGLLLMSGLCYIWLAFAEPSPAGQRPQR